LPAQPAEAVARALSRQESAYPVDPGIPLKDAFRVEPLGEAHDRSAFSCGIEALDRYFREQVTQDVRRRVTTCYVALEASGSRIAGYYTLSAAGVLLSELPRPLVKRLPRYPSVPVARMARLAVDQAYRGRNLGAALLWDAIARLMRSEIAVSALIADAKDDPAEAFYHHHGFVPFGIQPRQLILPLTKLGAGA
jgi:ribosomal protein S18 acetylase RimI-like enzyme